MIDMEKRAKDILEDYANSYSQVDLETLAKFLEQIEIEAIKGFAQKLKAKFLILFGCAIDCWSLDKHIDDLVKETAGVGNGRMDNCK